MKNSEKSSSESSKKHLESFERSEKREQTEAKERKASLPESEKDLPYNPEVTKEDLESLQHENIHTDGGDDETLRDRNEKVDFTGSDLDVPGSKTAEKLRKKGMPDEENQLFSQGGPDKENLEEDDSAL